MRSLKLTTLLVTLCTGLLVTNYCVDQPKKYEVRIVTPPTIIASLPHWVAQDNNLYTQAGLNIQTLDVTDSSLMTQALLGGDADVLPAVSLVDVVNASTKTPIKPLIYSHSRMYRKPPFEALTVMRGSSISTLRDLENKTIAVYPGVTAAAAVNYFLARNGVDTTSVTLIKLPPPEHIRALQRGDVDASHIYEPFRTLNLEGGRTRMISGSIYAYFTEGSAIGVSAIRPNFFQNHKEAAQRYLQVWNESISYIRNNPTEARSILAEHLSIPEPIAQTATWVDATKTTETDPTKVKQTVQVFQEMGVISDSAMIDSSYFIPDAR